MDLTNSGGRKNRRNKCDMLLHLLTEPVSDDDDDENEELDKIIHFKCGELDLKLKKHPLKQYSCGKTGYDKNLIGSSVWWHQINVSERIAFVTLDIGSSNFTDSNKISANP